MAVAQLKPAAGVMLVESDSLVRTLPGLLDGLSAEDRDRVLAISKPEILEIGMHVWRQGDIQSGIYMIESGRIRSYYAAPSGREVTLAYWAPGNFVGGPDLFGSGPHVWSSVAVERSALRFLSGPALRKVALSSAPIAVALLDALAFKARCYSAMAQMLGTRSVTERLHRLLVLLRQLALIHGRIEKDVAVVELDLTQGTLAQMLGASREAVNKQLRALIKEGRLSVEGHHIIIHRSAKDS